MEGYLEHFERKDYVVLKQVISHDLLYPLVQESEYIIDYLKNNGLDLVKDFGCIIEPSNDYVKKYIYNSIGKDYTTKRKTWSIFKEIERVAEEMGFGYKFHQQHIIKPPYNEFDEEKKSEFVKHKDGQYQPLELRKIKNIAVYIPLQRIDKFNGGLKLYPSEETAIDLILNLGDILIMSHELYHSSYENYSLKYRKAYMLQYSENKIIL